MRILITMVAVFWMAGCGPNNLKDMKFSGTLEITEHVLGAKSAGRVATMTVKEGDSVAQGQLLATLDRYEQTKKDLKRLEDIFKSGGVNAQAVEYAQLALEDQGVVSPIDGVVLVKTVEVGEIVLAGAGVIVIGNSNDQWVKVFVPEGVINRIGMNQVATVSLDGISQAYKGHVSFISPKAEFTPRNVQTPEERITQVFAVKVTLDQVNESLHAGVAADVRFDEVRL